MESGFLGMLLGNVLVRIDMISTKISVDFCLILPWQKLKHPWQFFCISSSLRYLGLFYIACRYPSSDSDAKAISKAAHLFGLASIR